MKGKNYMIKGLGLEQVWRDNPQTSDLKSPEPGIIKKGLSLYRYLLAITSKLVYSVLTN